MSSGASARRRRSPGAEAGQLRAGTRIVVDNWATKSSQMEGIRSLVKDPPQDLLGRIPGAAHQLWMFARANVNRAREQAWYIAPAIKINIKTIKQ